MQALNYSLAREKPKLKKTSVALYKAYGAERRRRKGDTDTRFSKRHDCRTQNFSEI